MKVKVFYGRTEDNLEKLVNNFLADKSRTIRDIKFDSTLFFFSAMIIYEEEPGQQ